MAQTHRVYDTMNPATCMLVLRLVSGERKRRGEEGAAEEAIAVGRRKEWGGRGGC